MEWHGKIRGRCERRPRMRDWRPVPWCWEAGVVRTPAPKVDSVTSGVTSCNSPGRGIVESLQMELSSVVDFDQGFGGIIWDTAFIVDALTGMPAGGRGPVRLATSVLST